MKQQTRSFKLLLISVIGGSILLGCTPAISTQQYNNVNNQLRQAQNDLTQAQNEISKIQSENSALKQQGKDIAIAYNNLKLENELLKLPTPTPTPTTILVTKDASQLVLTISDFEPGWTRLSANATTKQDAQSAYHSYFYQGTVYPPVVQNTVAVYPSIDAAKQVYLSEKPQNVSLEYPKIGDECFINTAVDINKLLVFRKSNVVVWIWLQQAIFNDIKPYAKIVEGKIR